MVAGHLGTLFILNSTLEGLLTIRNQSPLQIEKTRQRHANEASQTPG